MIYLNASKRADETVTVTIRFAGELASGETITTPAVSVVSGGVAVAGVVASESGLSVSARISSGTNGTNGVLLFGGTTSAGQVLARQVTLPVQSDS